MTGSTESEICSKMLREKFIATTHGYSMVKIACLDNAFSEFFELEPSRRSITAAKRKDKGEKEKENNLKKRKPKDLLGHFPVQTLVSKF